MAQKPNDKQAEASASSGSNPVNVQALAELLSSVGASANPGEAKAAPKPKKPVNVASALSRVDMAASLGGCAWPKQKLVDFLTVSGEKDPGVVRYVNLAKQAKPVWAETSIEAVADEGEEKGTPKGAKDQYLPWNIWAAAYMVRAMLGCLCGCVLCFLRSTPWRP